MANGIALKIYNKEDKLNILIRETKSIKIISIYKYNEENVDTHSFTYAKEGNELKKWDSYYDMSAQVDGVLSENVMMSIDFIEHNEFIDELSFIRTTTNLNSGNVYENRTKYFKGEKYAVEFKNGKLTEFDMRLHENKINEYLKTLQDGKEKS
jgi:hypothetical protein